MKTLKGLWAVVILGYAMARSAWWDLTGRPARFYVYEFNTGVAVFEATFSVLVLVTLIWYAWRNAIAVGRKRS